MNSSGIKRGLATTAVSALAIAGLPLIASSASAENGDVLQTAFAGPALDGDLGGALIVLKSKNIAEADVNTAGDLKVIAQNLTSSANNANQTIGDVEFVDFIADGASNEFGGADGFDEIVVRVPVDTRNIGDTAAFAIYLDDDATAGVQSTEPTTNVSVTTAGEVAQIQITPNAQTLPAGVQSSPYTITLKDSGGRTTQLADGDVLAIDGDGATIAPNNDVAPTTEDVTSDQLARGTFAFRATGGAVDVYNITATYNAITGRATLDVVESAAIDADELDIVSGADDWFSFSRNNGLGGADTFVAPNQSSLVFNFRSDDVAADRNDFVTVTFSSTDVTFGGASSITKQIRLSDTGTGSFTLDVDPASIQDGDDIDVTGTIDLDLVFQRAQIDGIMPEQAAYVAAPRGTTTVSAQVVDQYENPFAAGQLGAEITAGPNDGKTAPRVNVDNNGNANFTFTDTAAVPGNTDIVEFLYYTDSFDPTGSALGGGNTTEIRYTADGLGSDFTTRLENVTASGAGYDPASVFAAPLTDGVVDDNVQDLVAVNENEAVDLDVVSAEEDAAITVSVDNGALILAPGETRLDQGSASITDVVAGNILPNGYQIIGTKTGLVTVTVTSAGRTETSQFTVRQVSAPAATARNIELTGPESAVGGDTVVFVAKITDAFGNPVPGFARTNLNVTVGGPGAFQDGDAISDANGEIKLNVRLADDAGSPVTASVTATGAQFGAAANERTTAAGANSARGLAASVNSDSATIGTVTDIEALEQAVADAEAALARAEGDLAEAQGNLDVAQTELAVAQANVEALKERRADLRQKLNKAKRNDNKQKAKTTRKKLRAVKRDLRAAKDAVTIAAAKVAAEQDVVDRRQQAVTEAEEALAQAEADLEEAQN